MSEFPYHTTAAIARSERVSIEELRYLSCLAHAYYDKWRHNDRQRIDDLSRITALEAECALLKASLLEAEGREHEARLLTQDLSGKLAASEARVGVLEKALNEIAEWTERYTTPGHPISTVARAALSQPGKGE